MKKIILILVVVLVAVGVYWYLNVPADSDRGAVIASVTYACAEGKSIEATYYEGGAQVVVSPGEPPVPTGSVDVTLSDGRSMSLPQTLSASGIRYANVDESFIFWNKGNGAFAFEGDVQTYSECVEVENGN